VREGQLGVRLAAMQRLLRSEDCPNCGGQKSVRVFSIENITIEEGPAIPPGEEKFCERCQWHAQTRTDRAWPSA
jgi:hypothetical protein